MHVISRASWRVATPTSNIAVRQPILSTTSTPPPGSVLPSRAMPQHLHEPTRTRRKIPIFHAVADYLHTFPDDHALQIALRTYALSLSLSLGPALFSLLASGRLRKNGVRSLLYVLKRDLGASGFAFAMSVGVGGGAALKQLWDILEAENQVKPQDRSSTERPSFLWRVKSWLGSLHDSQKTFLANVASAYLAIVLLHSRTPPRKTSYAGPRHSMTLDLTLLFLVRAMDSVVRAVVFPLQDTFYLGEATNRGTEQRQLRRQRLTSRIDSFVFWASSARIMWCFFYKPDRLPRSYNKWIMALANLDPRLLDALRAIRNKDLCYVNGTCTPPDLLTSFARDLGYPEAWGDVSRMPAYGGPQANQVWASIGVASRPNLGGIPCELVHGGISGASCTANTLIRGAHAFAEALLIYLPVHFLPILLTRPRRLLRPSHLIQTLLSVIRSASFLSAFVSGVWASVCLTRTVLLARLFPFISHDFWDGPFGCTFVGSLLCGSSIWLEQGRRRGEIALYVLPRAIRSLFPKQWLQSRPITTIIERITFALSLATLLTAYTYRPDSLRGLSRWTLSFVMSGPNAGFWKRKRAETTTTTPVHPRSPDESHETHATDHNAVSHPISGL
ncbi:hypothetical protein NM688_g5007 [Phlebia brevispora]|uniref:Uncharacterized protein n=1 Tax=Phlebia brevispora TaxID=194682 RepID=A0ACC1T1D1_9APHY|nr:hypothetical protein NM688_g5007 [Phlebia brevispora]